jgi:hypothetical protein
MHIKTKEDLENLKIDTNAFNSYYMSNGGCSTCLMKGGAEMVEGEPSNLTAKDFMNHYFPLLRGGYENTKRKEGKQAKRKEGKRKEGKQVKRKEAKQAKRKEAKGGNTVEANDASKNFFHLISSTPGINHSSYPDLKFNSYSFPDSQLPQFR